MSLTRDTPNRSAASPRGQCSPSAGFPTRRIHPIRSIETRSPPGLLTPTLVTNASPARTLLSRVSRTLHSSSFLLSAIRVTFVTELPKPVALPNSETFLIETRLLPSSLLRSSLYVDRSHCPRPHASYLAALPSTRTISQTRVFHVARPNALHSQFLIETRSLLPSQLYLLCRSSHSLHS